MLVGNIIINTYKINSFVHGIEENKKMESGIKISGVEWGSELVAVLGKQERSH